MLSKGNPISITELTFSVNGALRKELEFFAQTEDGKKIYSAINSCDDVVAWVEANPNFMDLKLFVSQYPIGKVIDVGVGWGMSTAYLAIKGFSVRCVEPSKDSCQGMHELFKRLGLDVKIYQGIAECMDQIEDEVDYIIFWSSLHHCDDPVGALQNARNRLRPGGLVVLFEPVLRFYRTQKWFYRMMEENPLKVGHYGGNEHIYRYDAYLKFIEEAGLHHVVSIPSMKYIVPPFRAPWDSGLRWPIKQLYYRAIGPLTSLNSLAKILIQLSLLTPIIVAEKSLDLVNKASSE